MSDSRSNFPATITGFLCGTLAGAAAMYFLSPRSGRANRELVKNKVNELGEYVSEERAALEEKIQEIFGEVTALTTSLYNDARRLWEAQVRTFEKSMAKIDKTKYQEMVDNVMEKLQVNQKYDSDNLSKIKRYLNNQWRRFSDLMSA